MVDGKHWLPNSCSCCDNGTVDGVDFSSFPQCLERQEEMIDSWYLIWAPIFLHVESTWKSMLWSLGVHKDSILPNICINFCIRRHVLWAYTLKICFNSNIPLDRQCWFRDRNADITDVTFAIFRKDLLTDMLSPPSPSFLHKVGVCSPPNILNWEIISKNNTSNLGPDYLMETSFESLSMFGFRAFSPSLIRTRFFAIRCLYRKGMLTLIFFIRFALQYSTNPFPLDRWRSQCVVWLASMKTQKLTAKKLSQTRKRRPFTVF